MAPHTWQEITEGAILLVDKPKTWTSFDVVRKLRNIVGSKIGHGGTLDPLASGLLLIATGRKTKELNHLQDLPKEYTGVFHLGAVTPSYDLETEVTQTWDISHLTNEEIHRAATTFLGKIMQTPPAFSAIKIGGKPAYKMARKGKDPELTAREQEIFSFEIEKISLPQVHFRVFVSKGTYIRSLADDFGKALGVGAYLEELTRTKIGEYRLENAWPLDALVEELKSLKEQHASI